MTQTETSTDEIDPEMALDVAAALAEEYAEMLISFDASFHVLVDSLAKTDTSTFGDEGKAFHKAISDLANHLVTFRGEGGPMTEMANDFLNYMEQADEDEADADAVLALVQELLTTDGPVARALSRLVAQGLS